jgi:hypothetical protein
MFENKLFRRILRNVKEDRVTVILASYSAGLGFCSCLCYLLSRVVILIKRALLLYENSGFLSGIDERASFLGCDTVSIY